MTDEMERCTAAGMDDLLVKPLELARLCELLDRYGFRDGATLEAGAAAAAPLAGGKRARRRSPSTSSSSAPSSATIGNS